MSEFSYPAIDLSQRSFRLARLLSGSGATIYCSIFDAFLDQPSSLMPYETLSYTWGSNELTDSVTINGCQLAVTSNLFLALQYLRFKDEDRILWVDGLCIDQKNDKEKGHQVQQMGKIYHRAERVIIWLGPATYETNVLMDSIKRLEKESNKYSRNSLSSSGNAWQKIWSDIQPDLREIHSNLENRQQNALKYILGQPWFRRVWILQEVANSRNAIIACGEKSVSARVFALVPPLVGITPDSHCQAVLDIMPGQSREKSWWSQARKLSTLLAKFGESEASDTRDNIYALLDLSSDACNSEILKADYSKSFGAVLNDAASFIFRIPELFGTDLTFDWTIQHLVQAVYCVGNANVQWESTIHLPSDIRLLVALIRTDFDANSKQSHIKTPMMVAIEENNIKMVELFLAQKAIDVNAIGEKEGSQTLLEIAVREGREEIVRLLLGFDGIDVNRSRTSSPLKVALESGQAGAEKIVKLLLDNKDVNVNLRGSPNAPSPLMKVVESVHPGRTEILQMMLKRPELEVNSMTDMTTPLAAACGISYRDGDTSVVELLLTRGDIEVNTGAPIMNALRWGHTDIVRLLLARDDVDLDTKDYFGNTPQWFADNSPDPEVRSMLKRALEGVTLSVVADYRQIREVKSS